MTVTRWPAECLSHAQSGGRPLQQVLTCMQAHTLIDMCIYKLHSFDKSLLAQINSAIALPYHFNFLILLRRTKTKNSLKSIIVSKPLNYWIVCVKNANSRTGHKITSFNFFEDCFVYSTVMYMHKGHSVCILQLNETELSALWLPLLWYRGTSLWHTWEDNIITSFRITYT